MSSFYWRAGVSGNNNLPYYKLLPLQPPNESDSNYHSYPWNSPSSATPSYSSGYSVSTSASWPHGDDSKSSVTTWPHSEPTSAGWEHTTEDSWVH